MRSQLVCYIILGLQGIRLSQLRFDANLSSRHSLLPTKSSVFEDQASSTLSQITPAAPTESKLGTESPAPLYLPVQIRSPQSTRHGLEEGFLSVAADEQE